MSMERNIITINEYGSIILPEDIAGIWMGEPELVELFGVIAPALRAAIRAVYKSGVLNEHEGQKYVSKLDEIRQVEDFLHRQGVERLAMVVASSIGADLAMAFLTQTKLPVEHAFFDGGQFAQIGKGTRRIMTPFLYFAIKSLYWSKGGTLKKDPVV